MTTSPLLLRQLRDGIAAVQSKDFRNARVLLQPVAEAFPNDARPWFWLAVASPSANDAIPCLRKVLAIDASHAQARQALSRLLLTQASAFVTAGRREAARELVVEATTLTPDHDRAWVALAVVSDDPASRVDALRHAFGINPVPATRTHFAQSLIQLAQRTAAANRADASALYHEVLELDPHDLRAWHGLTGLADTTAEALDTVRALVLAAPEQEAGTVFLKKALLADARVLEVAGQSGEATLRWREALALDEFDIDAWLGLAQSTSDEDEAQRAITRAFDINPTDARVSSAMARMQDATLDAVNFEVPQDAFAHLEAGDDAFAVGAGDFASAIDLPADPFARFAPPESPSTAWSKPAAASVPMAVVAPAVAFPVVVAPVAEAPAPAPWAMAPAVLPASDDEPIAIEADASDSAPRRTVMIVDDSPTIRKILGLTLERAGYKVVAEPDGESALERLGQVVPDVILLDIAMPKIDGYEVCRRIKGDTRTAHVPVVMLSGKDAFFDKVKGRVAGASEYLTKPFETPAVLAAVAAACQPVRVRASA